MKKVFIVSLDGVPYSLLKKAFSQGKLSGLKNLFEENGTFTRIYSVIPTISSVAWTSFITGKNPGKHGIYGFIDRIPNPLQVYIPTGKNLNEKTIFEILSDFGKKVISINVPGTTPPRKINGVMIADFLTARLEKIVYPQELTKKLVDMKYIIDVNPMLAKENLDKFIDDLFLALEKRKEITLYLLEEISDWDFFMLHIMETDRIMHFLWAQMEDGDPKYGVLFWNFFEEVCNVLLELREKIPRETLFISLSDHGFTRLKKEFNTNFWLMEKGYLRFLSSSPKGINDLDPQTKVYSLIPGRFYINLLGRESIGSVPPYDYTKWREKIKEELYEIEDPDTGQKIIEKVYLREEIYKGPYLENAPDVIAHPVNGYDLKSNFNPQTLFSTSHINGMHTYDDAYLFIEGRDINQKEEIYLWDVTASILDYFSLSLSNLELDGASLL